MPEESIVMFALAIALAYVYAFVGGFTDAANSIATIAVAWLFRGVSRGRAVPCIGGWRIIHALGIQLTDLNPA